MALELGHAPLNVDSEREDNEQLMSSPRLVPRGMGRVKVFGAGAMMGVLAIGLIVLSMQAAQKPDDAIQNVPKGAQGLQMKDAVKTDLATPKAQISCALAKQRVKDADLALEWAKKEKDNKAEKFAKTETKAAEAARKDCIEAASGLSRWVDLDPEDAPTQAQRSCATAIQQEQDARVGLDWAKKAKDKVAKKAAKVALMIAKAFRKDIWGEECRNVAAAFCGTCIGCMKPNGRCKDKWKEEKCEAKKAIWCEVASGDVTTAWSASDAAAKLLANKQKLSGAILAAAVTATQGELTNLVLTDLTCVATSVPHGQLELTMDSSTVALADSQFPRWIAEGIATTMGCDKSQVDVWIKPVRRLTTDGAGRRLTSAVSVNFNVYSPTRGRNIGLGIDLGVVAPGLGFGLGLGV